MEIKLLSDYPEYTPRLSEIHYEGIGRHFSADATPESYIEKLQAHLNHEKLPLTFVAIQDNQPIGMASLRINDGLRPDLEPWLGGLIVDPDYRKQKIGERLITAIKDKAVEFSYDRLYLLTFDKTLPNWYRQLGWQKAGFDKLLGHTVTVMSIYLGENE